MSFILSRRLPATLACAVLLLAAACGGNKTPFMESAAGPDVNEPVPLESVLSPEELEAEFSDVALPTPGGSSPDQVLEPKAQQAVPKYDPLRDQLTDELLAHFDLLLVVNKAAKGTTAQTLRVYQKNGQQWDQLYSWLVSTGREKQERYFTSTPRGIYKLDRQRFFKMTYSKTWDGAEMPFAMFLDFSYANRKTGIALHAAPANKEKLLGQRASGGCVRLSYQNAGALFQMLTSGAYDGMVPKFPFDKTAGRTNYKGQMVRDATGAPVLVPGLKALLVILEERD